jgi:DNA topoisomerase IA
MILRKSFWLFLPYASVSLNKVHQKFPKITFIIINVPSNCLQAVDVRQELDLRIGAAFTRFQTMRLQKKFAEFNQRLISYGSCQFPTLGFVVERYKAIESFVPENFWKIKG